MQIILLRGSNTLCSMGNDAGDFSKISLLKQLYDIWANFIYLLVFRTVSFFTWAKIHAMQVAVQKWFIAITSFTQLLFTSHVL